MSNGYKKNCFNTNQKKSKKFWCQCNSLSFSLSEKESSSTINITPHTHSSKRNQILNQDFNFGETHYCWRQALCRWCRHSNKIKIETQIFWVFYFLNTKINFIIWHVNFNSWCDIYFKNNATKLFYNIFTKSWCGQRLISFHLGFSLISFFHLPIITHHINNL